jgi:DNA-binding response OmpR family regulator
VTGLLLSDDLLFTSRVTATARAHGLSVAVAKTADAALKLAKQSPLTGVLVDLQNPGLDLPAFLMGLRDVCSTMPRVIGYGSHVAVDVLKAARQAGCDQVMPRSQFASQLEEGLKEWLR